MILNKRPLTLAEAKSYVKASDKKSPVEDYFKSFVKITKDKADKLSEEIRALNNPKIREETLVKVADFLPRDSEDINKIFIEATLNEEETNVILEIVKKY